MSSDRSRPPDPVSDAYTGVAMQQGRVLLDRDFNAARDIVDHRDRVTTRDLVGPTGTPDNGFQIAPLPRLLPLPFRRFPPPRSPPQADDNLRIGAGTMYVGGLRVEFPAEPGGVAAEYSYFAQPDWLDPDPPAAPRTEIVWLQLDEQEISATEDPDLLEVALGGPDSTQRLRLLRTVRRAVATGTGCTTAWAALLQQWATQGIGFDPRSMMRVPTARMQVAFNQPAAAANPCDPTAAGGYLFSENQLIRVKFVAPAAVGGQGTLLWGYDDASFIYRASLDQTGTQLTLSRQPPDAYHFPGQNQFVEVLRTTALIGAGDNTSAEDGNGLLPRCIAEATGFVTTLASAYDPASANATLSLSASVPPDYVAAAASEPLFVRIWQCGQAMGPQGGSMDLVDPVTGSDNGVTVTITTPGGAIAPGTFWMMALRPGTPQALWPATLLASPQPPDGPRSWACPLAVVEWPSETPRIHDCRLKFDNLVDLTARPIGCCTVYLSPDEITIDRTLQSVIDGMTAPGTLCLGPGAYILQAPLRIGSAQAGLTIVAENGATLSAASGAEPAFSDGLVVIAGAANVTLRGLTLVPPAVAIPAGLLTGLANLTRIGQLPTLQDGLKFLLEGIERGIANRLFTTIGLRAAGCTGLTVQDCQVTLAVPAGGSPGPLFAIGLLASGACAHLTVRGCRFDADTLAPTQTFGLPQEGGFLGQNFNAKQDDSAEVQGAVGILASPCAARFLAADKIIFTDAETRTLNGLTGADGKLIVERGAANATVDPAIFRIDAQDMFTTIPDFTGAVIENNVFTSMIVAVSAFGLLDQARIAGNSITGSSAGIWLRPIEEARFNFSPPAANPLAGGPVVAVSGDIMWLKLVLLQKEAFISWLLGLLLPIPAGAVAGTFATTSGGATLRVTDNAVAALQGASAGGPGKGMPALAIVTGLFSVSPDIGPGFIVAGNRLQARTPPAYPACVLALSGRLAVTGNLISSEPIASPPTEAALAIFPENNDGRIDAVTAPRICVTGNVLEGLTNLANLLRTDAGLLAPLNTWVPFNAGA